MNRILLFFSLIFLFSINICGQNSPASAIKIYFFANSNIINYDSSYIKSVDESKISSFVAIQSMITVINDSVWAKDFKINVSVTSNYNECSKFGESLSLARTLKIVEIIRSYGIPYNKISFQIDDCENINNEYYKKYGIGWTMQKATISFR